MVKIAVLLSLLLPLAASRRWGPWRYSERATDSNLICSCPPGTVNNGASSGANPNAAGTGNAPPSVEQSPKGGAPPATQGPNTAHAPSSNQAIWKPAVGATWDITLATNPVFDSGTGRPKPDVDVYTVDVEEAAVISKLHSLNKKVICYFSVGTSEPFRNDVKGLPSKVIGSRMAEWDEEWLDIRTPEVRALMKQRITQAAARKCDAIDPDNIDGFENGNIGLARPLTLADTVDFVKFLADEAHALGMSIGQKNAGQAVSSLVNVLDFCVQEQCIADRDCNIFAPYIQAGKAVFNIEYPGKNSQASSDVSAAVCRSKPSGFSTIIKTLKLDGWVYTCN